MKFWNFKTQIRNIIHLQLYNFSFVLDNFATALNDSYFLTTVKTFII